MNNDVNKKIKLLDCTLRDGGYINDWRFGFHTAKDIIIKMIDSGVDYVEVGFLRDCEYDRDVVLFNSNKNPSVQSVPYHLSSNVNHT